MVVRALLLAENESGDIGVIAQHDHIIFMGLVDVLGHGREANEIALIAKEYLDEHTRDEDIVAVMNGLHEHIRGTRGAVAGFCRVNLANGELSYTGIGNITVRILGTKSKRMLSRDGIVGYSMAKPQLTTYQLVPGDTIIMHSDGMKEHFDQHELGGLLLNRADRIADELVDRYGTKTDDVSCIVMKFGI